MQGAQPFVPARLSRASLRQALQHCRGCDLYRNGTHAVPGSGARHPRMVLVGEQPGDEEERAGEPFVGPAGRFLRATLGELGMPPGELYFSNAVKHFRFTMRGKRRIHKKPASYQIGACRPWLEAELRWLQPQVLVLLGATAAWSLLGPSVRVLRDRGGWMPSPWCARTLVTLHPAAVLRMPDREAREKARRQLLADLRLAAAACVAEVSTAPVPS
jgi:DNA polymerase